MAVPVFTFDEYARSLGGHTHLYANASNAYKDVLAHLRERSRSSRPNVVIPSYMPAKLYRASLAAGCAVRFYEVSGACTADLEQLAAAIDEDTVGVLFIHYFGFPDRIEETASVVRSRSRTAALIEDCALTLGAEHDGKRLGTFGDAALFSMRKMFMFSEGGMLRTGDALADFRPRYESRVRSVFSMRHFALQRAKYAYVRLTRGADPLGLFRYDGLGQMSFSAPQVQTVKMLSRFTRARLPLEDVAAAAASRRRNFAFLAERFPLAPWLTPIHTSLAPGTVPYSFPFLVDPSRRDEHRRELLRHGVVAGAGWPEAPFDGLAPTSRLAASLLELPLHQSLTDDQLHRSIRALEAIATKRSP